MDHIAIMQKSWGLTEKIAAGQKVIGIEEPDIPKFYELFKHKRYCILIFLKHGKRTQPFEISKQGFGVMASWICVENVAEIRK
jgi:hypothetical protein